MKLLSIIYYLGLIACGMQGAEKSYQQHTFFCLPASFFSALGGGMVRDLFLLFVFPFAFTKACLPDIIIALCSGIFYRFYLQKHTVQNKIKPFAILIDALGIGTFIAMGIDKALNLGANHTIALCCGIVTALGGGILSSLLCGQSVHKVLTVGVTYRIVTIFGAFLYMYCLSNGINQIIAQYYLILYTLLFIPISNYNLGAIQLKHHASMFQHPSMTIPFIPMAVILYQPNNYYTYTSHSAWSFYLLASHSVWNKDFSHVKYTVTWLNYKSRCPRRFSRGR